MGYPNMYRRDAITFLVAEILMSGCTLNGSGRESKQKAVGVRIQNNSPDQKEVQITVSERGNVVFEGTYTVESGPAVVQEGLIEAGSYEVTAFVDGVGTKTEDWSMAGCDSNEISVSFDENTLRITRASVCD